MLNGKFIVINLVISDTLVIFKKLLVPVIMKLKIEVIFVIIFVLEFAS